MDINKTLEELRVSYQSAKLDASDCAKDPIDQFNRWFQESLHAKCDEPNAMVLSTVIKGQPRARVVLLKGIHEGKFVFYTNYESAKGNELATNDKVAITFLWLPLQRQVRIEGTVKRMDEHLSDDYFRKRPRGSQIGAWASPQSRIVKDRRELEDLFSDAEKKFKELDTLPRPIHWGGYGVEPHFVEFWQGRDNRMHDRIAYEKSGSSWKIYRLAP
jgi:pyridoxamine 5'-phosphate oxidase